MKRKHTNVTDEEAKVSKLLFNKPNNFIEAISSKSELKQDLKPAWIDEDDNQFRANIIPNVKSKGLYTEKLKQKYETLMGTPSWAQLNNRDKIGDDQDEILRTVGHLHDKKSDSLPKDFIEIKSFPQINAATRNEGAIITSIEFHPKISAALVAGNSGTVSLFSIGGDVNEKIHQFNLSNWKISSAQFTPDGTEALITSKHSHTYCSYNLVKAESKLIQLPRVVKRPHIFQISPDGKMIATSDGCEEISLLSAVSKELLASLKHNSNVVSLIFSHDCRFIYCYSDEALVTIWDLKTYRAIKKFTDHGCVKASCLTISPCGQLLATGSGEGIVNIYQTENITTSQPLPFKVIENLTTKITNLKFNPTSEILAASSSFISNAVKLIHIPSYHVYANFPNQAMNINHVNTLSFTPNSGYMALGNNKGQALLYRLKYYKNY